MVADVGGESIHQQHPRIGFADAPLTHVEHGLLVELSGGGAVRALHVVGIDLKERLGVDLGRGGQDDVGVVLLGIGLLCPGCHIHMAVEDRRGLVVDDALEAGSDGDNHALPCKLGCCFG